MASAQYSYVLGLTGLVLCLMLQEEWTFRILPILIIKFTKVFDTIGDSFKNFPAQVLHSNHYEYLVRAEIRTTIST